MVNRIVGDTESVTIEHLQEMGLEVANGRMSVDITRPWKVKAMSSIGLGPIILKTAGDMLSQDFM